MIYFYQVFENLQDLILVMMFDKVFALSLNKDICKEEEIEEGCQVEEAVANQSKHVIHLSQGSYEKINIA
jgi:hypothetical protein